MLFALLVAVCAGRPPAASPPRVVAVRPAAELDRSFGDYADHDRAPRHWTGGDSTYSVRAAAGELWLFSDSFLGSVRPDGSRPAAAPFVHNSAVLWAAGGPRTTAPLVSVPEADGWYWSRAGIADGAGVSVVLARYAKTGTGPLDVAWRGNALARFGPGPPSRPRSFTPLPSSARVAWGAWLARHGADTYVYGTEKAPTGNHLHLARVTGTDLRRPWWYWTARGAWSRDESRSARLSGPDGTALLTSDELSVVRHGGWYALCAQRVDQPFSAEVQLAWSRSPSGPFTRPRTVFTAPEAGPRGTYRDADVIAYNPHEHPEFEHPGELVVSYNVNSLDPRDVYR
ncbi:hypothetical protein, partial [Streptomyces sp. UNOC14_S4]|uniref:hypothetical protein n=1 Tax=Streptomyces sp. UNOC14_S4 TaxID=2872340 RepID=UPI001E401039